MRDLKKASDTIVNWLKAQAKAAKVKGFVVGVSGGVDSALVSSLCAFTNLPTLCLEMPIHQEAGQRMLAQEHIRQLVIRYPENVFGLMVDLSTTNDVFKLELANVQAFRTMWSTDYSKRKEELALANSRSRLRMTALYAYANMYDLLVAGTGNRVEDLGIGFFTKGGDGMVDLSPIGDLLKTEVWAMARMLGVSDGICSAKPTDGLWADNRGDEDQIGATYPELEEAMAVCADNGFETLEDFLRCPITELPKGSDWSDRKTEVMKIYLTRHANGAHKMQMPPVCELVNE